MVAYVTPSDRWMCVVPDPRAERRPLQPNQSDPGWRASASATGRPPALAPRSDGCGTLLDMPTSRPMGQHLPLEPGRLGSTGGTGLNANGTAESQPLSHIAVRTCQAHVAAPKKPDP